MSKRTASTTRRSKAKKTKGNAVKMRLMDKIALWMLVAMLLFFISP